MCGQAIGVLNHGPGRGLTTTRTISEALVDQPLLDRCLGVAAGHRADHVVGRAVVVDGGRPVSVDADLTRDTLLHLLLFTMCNTVDMSVNVSVRLDDRLAERLRLRARAAGESLSDRLRRYAEEGARRDEHPMITFRDGPSGRRAGLMGGPDVWEVAMWTDDLASAKDPAAALAADGVVSRPQIDAALAYRAAYPDEIQARIELHRSETAAAEAR